MLDFADSGDFCDQPVKLYSSGIFVYLAFAPAIQSSPDLLIIEEALVVGDVLFSKEMFSKIKELKERHNIYFRIVCH